MIKSYCSELHYIDHMVVEWAAGLNLDRIGFIELDFHTKLIGRFKG